jgi:S1-C subfamily serine protease
MKKIILMIVVILLVFFVTGLNPKDKPASDISKLESEVKMILKTVSPSILKVIAEDHRINFATGIAIDTSHVVSNLGVIRNPYKEIYIETVNGKKFAAKVVGKDNFSSLILLAIDQNVLTPVKKAQHYEVGDWVALVGAFYKEFPSIYQGILSSALEDQVILNAPVVPGSSGGAVVNKKGELIGVIRGRVGFAFSPDYTFKDHSGEIHIQGARTQFKDLCAAVPVNKVVDITNDLKSFGKVSRGWIGVRISPGDNGLVKIDEISKNSPAQKAGLRDGDMILTIDGKSIKTPDEVSRVVKALKPQQKVKVEFLRGKTKESALMVIGESRESNFAWRSRVNPGRGGYNFMFEFPESPPLQKRFLYTISGNRTLGVEVMALTPGLAREFNIKEGSGLMVSKVYENTAADKAGFREADIIVKAGNKFIKTNSDLRNVLNESKDNKAVVIRFYRKGKPLEVKVEPDKKEGLGVMWDRFRDMMENVNVRIIEEKCRQIEDEVRDEVREERVKLDHVREKYLKEMEHIKEKELQEYKAKLEKLRSEQEKMQQKIKQLQQQLEQEKKKKTTTKI